MAARQYRFTLQPYKSPSSRHTCPECAKRQVFVRYIDTQGALEFPDYVGRCNRSDNCGYHYTPKAYFKDKGISFDRDGNPKNWNDATAGKPAARPIPQPKPDKPPSFIDRATMEATLANYDQNNFAKFLRAKFGPELADAALRRYRVGTSDHWNRAGANFFWQIDDQGNVRTGKVMLYNPVTGKRDKRECRKPNWAHRVFNVGNDFQLCQCLFGEHLLADNFDMQVGLVESEKTAIVASLYFPNMLWVACGGKDGLAILERSSAMHRRQIIFFPDAGKPAGTPQQTPFERWNLKANEMRQSGFQIVVDDMVENAATDAQREQGYDLADYLLPYELSDFYAPEQAPGSAPAPDASLAHPQATRIDYGQLHGVWREAETVWSKIMEANSEPERVRLLKQHHILVAQFQRDLSTYTMPYLKSDDGDASDALKTNVF